MTNIEWLNINNRFDEFLEDCEAYYWEKICEKYHISYKSKNVAYSYLKIVAEWLNSKHKELKQCIDKDALLEYIEDNNTSNNEEYYRIRIDSFIKFVESLDVHEIEI